MDFIANFTADQNFSPSYCVNCDGSCNCSNSSNLSPSFCIKCNSRCKCSNSSNLCEECIDPLDYLDTDKL